MDCSDEASNPAEENLTEYELQRLQRIRENNAVLAALDFPALADSLRESPASTKQRKHAAKRTPVGNTPRRSARLRINSGERKVMRDLSSSSGDESDSAEQEAELETGGRKVDAEYEPNDDDEEGDEEEEAEDGKSASDSELGTSQSQSILRLSVNKLVPVVQKKTKHGKSFTARQLWISCDNPVDPRPTTKGKKHQSGVKKRKMLKAGLPNQLPAPDQLLGQHATFGDTDELELQKALAMSIGASFPEGEGVSVPDSSEPSAIMENTKQMPSRGDGQGAKSKRYLKSKKVELGLTEDEIIRCFFLMDESVTGEVTFGDLQRLAAAHDFTWTNEELLDMIDLFNANSDGKLSLEEFRDIALRCNRR